MAGPANRPISPLDAQDLLISLILPKTPVSENLPALSTKTTTPDLYEIYNPNILQLTPFG
jgi:hypothetical protein